MTVVAGKNFGLDVDSLSAYGISDILVSVVLDSLID